MSKLLRGPILSRAVRDYVVDYIVDNEMRASDPLPTEYELADTLGVGRGAVREAVKSLESLGIVQTKHGKGSFVREYNLDSMVEMFLYGIQLDFKSLLELLRIRRWLELAVMDEVVEKITPDDLIELEDVLARWQERSDGGEWPLPDLDEAFHRVLHRSLENDMLEHLSSVFWALKRRLRERTNLDLLPVGPRVIGEHRAILEGIRNHDAEKARQAVKQSYVGAMELLQNHIDLKSPQSAVEDSNSHANES